MFHRLRSAARALVVPATMLIAAEVALAQDANVAARPDTVAADTSGVRQRDVSDLFRAITKKPARTELVSKPTPGLSLTLLPSVGYNLSFGGYFGASIALGGWLGDPETTQLSSGSISATYSTSEQISVQFRSDFYLKDNGWVLKGDWRYLDTSQPTFGLGPAVDGRSEYPMDFRLYRLYQTVYKRTADSHLYFGVGYHYDEYADIRDPRAEAGETTPFSAYSGGTPSKTQSSGISVNVLLDTRDNPINAARGTYWNASLRSYARRLGADDDRQSLWSDFRTFGRLPGSSRNVLAVWSYLWFTFGPPPYLELPAIGWDTYGRSGRGYVQGHIRGENQAYVEFEYRMHFTRDDLWGGVAFVNLISTSRNETGSFGSLDPGYGLGLRLKFTKRTNTNLCADAARGQDNKTRWYFALQEAY